MRVTAAFLVAAGFLTSTPSLAQPWNPIGRTDRDGKPGKAVLPADLSAPLVDDTWTEAKAKRIYGKGLGPTALNGTMEFIYPLYDWTFNDFDDDIARDLAAGCRAAFPGDSWGQIGCASQAVEMFLEHHTLDEGLRSPCRSHARAFKEVVDQLDLPGVHVSYLAMPGHVLNRLFVTTPTGQVFQYAIDVGWNEDRVYPHNEAARRWHDRNGDGKTDFKGLPPLPVRGQTIDYSFRPAAPSSGANVSRDSATNGASGAASTSSAAGAGIPR
jgi:hypothetical protein